MNEFPRFHPNVPALHQLSSSRMNKISIGQKSNQIQPGAGYRVVQTPGGTTVSAVKKRTPSQILPPLWVTMYQDGDEWKIYAETAFIVPRHNESAATGEPIAITSIPTIDSPLTVANGDKVWVKLTIDVNGRVTAGVFEKGSDWINDVEPVLVGGNLAGTAGIRYFRVASFETSGDFLSKTQILVGDIDHFQPTLVENLISSPSTGEARLMKEWNESEGRWDFRYLKSGDGITISEDGDFITIAGSHPWQATANGANIDIAPGKMFYPSPKGSTPEDVTPIIYDYVSYAGGSVTPTGSGWIYAKGEVAGVVTVGGQDGLNIQTTGSDLNSVLLEVRTLTSLGIVFSEYGPSAFDPADGNIYFPIAEVSSSGGSASVVDQILTHNPHDSLHQITFS